MPPPKEANDLKAKGNICFSKHEWLNAIGFYTEAIDVYGQDPSYYSNRAQVNLPSQLHAKDANIIAPTGQHQIGTVWLCHR